VRQAFPSPDPLVLGREREPWPTTNERFRDDPHAHIDRTVLLCSLPLRTSGRAILSVRAAAVAPVVHAAAYPSKSTT
jgi:hypothetical protein